VKRPRATVGGVNERDYWLSPNETRPQVSDNAQSREVLLVDRYGKPLIVREPRPVGFRKP